MVGEAWNHFGENLVVNKAGDNGGNKIIEDLVSHDNNLYFV